MHDIETLERNFKNLPSHPTDRGRVSMIILRLGEAKHRRVDRAEVSVEHGVVGDRWSAGEKRERHSQVTLINSSVAELIGHDGMPGWGSGDNFQVTLDLSETNLPVGTRLRVGGTLMEVTWKPHRGCAKFSARFGADALRWISTDENRSLRLRGIHCEVIEPGEVAVGDEVTVLR